MGIVVSVLYTCMMRWRRCLSTKAGDWSFDLPEWTTALSNGFLLLHEMLQEFQKHGPWTNHDVHAYRWAKNNCHDMFVHCRGIDVTCHPIFTQSFQFNPIWSKTWIQLFCNGIQMFLDLMTKQKFMLNFLFVLMSVILMSSYVDVRSLGWG